MKKKISIFILLTISLYLNAHEIKLLSTFTIWGRVDLREMSGFEQPVKYKTLNHESGLKVRVLETGNKEKFINEDNMKSEGIWLKVLNTASFWSEEWEFIQRGNEFWVFVSDDTMISDYEE